MKLTVSKGITVIANTQEANNAIVTTLKMSAVYSPTADSSEKNTQKCG